MRPNKGNNKLILVRTLVHTISFLLLFTPTYCDTLTMSLSTPLTSTSLRLSISLPKIKEKKTKEKKEDFFFPKSTALRPKSTFH